MSCFHAILRVLRVTVVAPYDGHFTIRLVYFSSLLMRTILAYISIHVVPQEELCLIGLRWRLRL